MNLKQKNIREKKTILNKNFKRGPKLICFAKRVFFFFFLNPYPNFKTNSSSDVSVIKRYYYWKTLLDMTAKKW